MPLFEPLVPELSRNHFEAGRSSFKVFKPNYSSVFGFDNRNNLTHINNVIDVAHNNDSTKEINNLLERYERILILAGPQIDIDEAETICSFGEALQAPILADPLSNVRGCSTSKVVISTLSLIHIFLLGS